MSKIKRKYKGKHFFDFKILDAFFYSHNKLLRGSVTVKMKLINKIIFKSEKMEISSFSREATYVDDKNFVEYNKILIFIIFLDICLDEILSKLL